MTTRTAFTLTLSALLLGGSMVGCTAQHGGLAAMSEAANGRAVQFAADAAANARAAMAKHKAGAAVTAAETAVRWQPQDATYRALLGQTYLNAGRFASARDALTDALTLAPDDGRIALNLALAQIASGEWEAARQTLASHTGQIPAADLGLALALAGDPGDAVRMLTDAARMPDADAKTRQNLALSLALAGRWTESRAVAALDLGADQLDRRIEQWAAFAYPKAAADQVASLLGVSPVADGGQPASLALNATVPAAAKAPEALAVQTPAVEAAPAEAEAQAPAPQLADAEPAPVQAAPQAAIGNDVAVTAPNPAPTARPGVAFGERREVAQSLPAAPVPAKAVPVKVAMIHAPFAAAPVKGNFYVQLGAYDSAGVAHDGWVRATRRYRALADLTPQGMAVTANGANFYRLSVGGFSRPEAVAMCRSYRAKGGVCFVRAGAGDQIAQWVQPKGAKLAKTAQPKRVQLASR